MKQKLLNLLLKLTDRELFKKPQSTKIREQVVSDIMRVDPSKWYNPPLPDGQVAKGWGTIKYNDDGTTSYEPGKFDLYTEKHPDLDYAIKNYPSCTYKEGELDNLTGKDMEVIRAAKYSINTPHWYVGQFESSWHVVRHRLERFFIDAAQIILFLGAVIGAVALIITNFPAESLFIGVSAGMIAILTLLLHGIADILFKKK